MQTSEGGGGGGGSAKSGHVHTQGYKIGQNLRRPLNVGRLLMISSIKLLC